jgi:hypothetical protein
MLDHVAPLVLLAALDQRQCAEALDDGLAQRLAAIDHPQPRTIGIEPSIDQIAEQRAHDPAGLGGALAQPQHVLVSLGVDAQGHQDDAVTEVDAIGHHDWQIQFLDRPTQPLVQLRLAQRHPAPRHRALGHRQRLVGLGQLVQGAGIAARGHPGGQ